jgi:hypothetical protein
MPKKFLTVALIAILLTGCTTWRPEPDLGRVPTDEPRGRVRITREDGTQLVLTEAVVHADSLVGFEEIPGFEDSVRESVALSDVRTIEVRRTNRLLVFGIVVAALAIIYDHGQTGVVGAS